MLITDLLHYLKNPTPSIEQPSNRRSIVNTVLYSYLIYLVLALCSYCLVKIIDVSIAHVYHFSLLDEFNKHSKKLELRLGQFTPLVIFFAGPLFEEMLFRLPLDLRKSSVALSLTALALWLFKKGFSIDFNEAISYFKLGAAIAAFVFIYLLVSARAAKIRDHYFKYFFYASSALFALVHVSNFAPYHNETLLIYPLYTLPQFFMGLVVGHLRISHGFFAGLALHMLINLPSALTYL